MPTERLNDSDRSHANPHSHLNRAHEALNAASPDGLCALIDGAPCYSGIPLTVVDPSTGQTIASVGEADHGRLKARLRPMRGLKTDRTASAGKQARRRRWSSMSRIWSGTSANSWCLNPVTSSTRAHRLELAWA